MAGTLYFGMTGSTLTYDLMNANIKVAAPGWQTTYQEGRATETIQMVARSVTDANFVEACGSIDAFADAARRYHMDDFRTQSGWLYASAGSGDGLRRALVYNVTHTVESSDDFVNPTLGKNYVRSVLAVERGEWWESDSWTRGTANSTISYWGGTINVTGITGDAPGRIYDMSFGPGAVSGTCSEMWIGIREKRYGLSGFVPVVECENGTAASADTVAVTGVADASGTAVYNVMRTNFATIATDAARVTVTLTQTGGTPSHFVGEYLALGRLKVTGTTTAWVTLKTGYSGGVFASSGQPVQVSGTSWYLYPLGNVSVPDVKNSAYSYNQGDYALQVWAERTAGTAAANALDIDSILLMPSERIVHISGGKLDNYISVNVIEDDTVMVHNLSSSSVEINSVEWSAENWRMPIGDNLIVVAGQRDAIHVLADAILPRTPPQLDFSIYVYPRWRNYIHSGTWPVVW